MAEELGFYPEEEDPFDQKISAARSDDDVGFEEVVLEYVRDSSMAKWLRWQLAVDFATENWAKGLPRPAIEKMLYNYYVLEEGKTGEAASTSRGNGSRRRKLVKKIYRPTSKEDGDPSP